MDKILGEGNTTVYLIVILNKYSIIRRREKIYKKYEARKAKQEAATSITLAVTKRNVVTTTPRVGS